MHRNEIRCPQLPDTKEIISVTEVSFAIQRCFFFTMAPAKQIWHINFTPSKLERPTVAISLRMSEVSNYQEQF